MSDITVTVSATAADSVRVPEIEVIIRRGAEVVLRRTVPPGEYVLGSDRSADLRLELQRVAPEHARLTVQGAEIFIEDLGSEHGTRVDGRQITGRTAVRLSQKIQVGEATIEAQRLDAPQVRLAPASQNLAGVRRLLPEGIVRERKYDIGAVVAEGGMGKVLDAHDALIRRNVAMKVMLKEKAAEDAARFIQEAQITGQLEHPSIVPIYELGVDEFGEPFYTMKFVRGITLRRILQLLKAGDREAVAKFPLAALLTAFQKVCDAVAFAHSRQVIHRDLKPDNIMLGDFGEVLVMDWGLAKVMGGAECPPVTVEPSSDRHFPAISSGAYGEGASMTIKGAIMGTPQFMSPEQARGDIESLDGRSDIYALGAILYQILTLRPVVEGGSVAQMLDEVCLGRIKAPAAIRGAKPLPHLPNGRVPESLSAVCMQALAPDRDARYACVAELQQEIQAYQDGFATSAERAGLFKLIHLAVLRHKTEAAIVSGSLLLLLALGVVAFHHVQLERDIAQSERNDAKRARDRAETTLDRLRATAPTFHAQAQALLEAGDSEGAIEKIAFAISLQPNNPEYVLFRANLLQSSQRMSEAADGFRSVLRLRPDDAHAQKNLGICEGLLAGQTPDAPLSREKQVELFEALIAQGRNIEAAPLALVLGQGQEAVEVALRARLQEYRTQIGWNDRRIRPLPNGMLAVNLNGLKLGDLTKLHGYPIRELDLGNTGAPNLHIVAQLPLAKLVLNYNRHTDLSPIRNLRLTFLDIRSSTITDLSPLASMPLDTLILDATRVSDLSPLRGMPIKTCSMRTTTRVTDLSPLAGMPIEDLDLQNTHVRDLSPLRGMPLRRLALGFAPNIDDFEPILDCRTLEELVLPFYGIAIPAVGNFPNLHRISITGWTADFIPPSRYLAHTLIRAAPYLQLFGVVHAQLGGRPPPGAVRVDALGELTASLAGLPIRDLTGIEGLPIKRLVLSRTQVTDLTPLRELPLSALRLDATPVQDIAPLMGLKNLEELVLPRDARNIALLRQLPKLRYLSKTWNEALQLPAQTAEVFWAEFDAAHPPAK